MLSFSIWNSVTVCQASLVSRTLLCHSHIRYQEHFVFVIFAILYMCVISHSVSVKKLAPINLSMSVCQYVIMKLLKMLGREINVI